MHPTLFHLGHLSLPTFGALAAVGLMLALLLSERTALLACIDPAKLWDAGIFAVLSAFVLSRVLLVITYWKTFAAFPFLLLTVPSLTPIGLLLTAIATAVWLWFKRVPLLAALNAWAPCATLVWACLGLGHWAEGSDPGMPLGSSTHPIGLYVGVFATALTLASSILLRRHTPAVAGWTLIASGAGQFLISFFRAPGTSGFAGLDQLQLLSLALIVAGSALIAARFWRVRDNREATTTAP